MEASASFTAFSPPPSDRLSPPAPLYQSSDDLQNHTHKGGSKSYRLYKVVPTTDPWRRFQEPSFHNSSKLAEEAYTTAIRPWPNTQLASPRRRLPQTSTKVWEGKKAHNAKKPSFQVKPADNKPSGNQSESRQTQLSEFKWASPYEESLVNSHLHSIQSPEVTRRVQLPDNSSVLVSVRLEPLLTALLQQRMIQTVVKFLYSDSHAPFAGAFHYVFCFNRREPLERVEDCPIDTTTLILAHKAKLSMDTQRAGFDVAQQAIVNMEKVRNRANSLVPLSAIVERSEALSKLSKKQSSPVPFKPQMLPSSVVTAIDFPPFHDSGFLRKSLMQKQRHKAVPHNPQSLVSKKSKSDLTRANAGADMPYGSELFGDQGKWFAGGHRKSLPVKKLMEGNAGFRKKPEEEREKDREKAVGEVSVTARVTAIKADPKAKKFMQQLTSSILRQLDAETFCARYSLTPAEFSNLLETFAVLSVTGYQRLPTVAEGVQVRVLCDYYKVSLEALRGVNLHLFDFPVTDSLDLMRVIPPSGVVSWTDFVTFHTLAVAQRAELIDLVPFLLKVSATQFARVSKLPQLDISALVESMRTRFLPPSRFNDTLQRIWTKFCECLTKGKESLGGIGDTIDIGAAVNSVKSGGPSLLELRFLVAEVFRREE